MSRVRNDSEMTEKTTTETETKYFVKDVYQNKLIEVKDVWESFTGWYWFITDIDETDSKYAYGLVIGTETEWGDIWVPELLDLFKKGKAWGVPKKNWSSISHIITKRSD
jgi:hypothetical protein